MSASGGYGGPLSLPGMQVWMVGTGAQCMRALFLPVFWLPRMRCMLPFFILPVIMLHARALAL